MISETLEDHGSEVVTSMEDSEESPKQEVHSDEQDQGGGGELRESDKDGHLKIKDVEERFMGRLPIDRPARERKTVERYFSTWSVSKVASIEKGHGTQLKDIPNVAFKLSKRKADGNLQMLHTILFGKKTTAHKLKRNIGQFSGYVWSESEEKHRARLKDKLDKCVKDRLLDFCDVLNIQINKASTRKEKLCAKLLEFLESPHATTDVVLPDKEQKGKKRKKKASMRKTIRSGGTSAETSSKKQKQNRQNGEKRKRTSKVEEESYDEGLPSDAEDFSHEDDDNDARSKDERDKMDSESDVEEVEQVEQMSRRKNLSKKNVKDSSCAIMKEKSTPVKKGAPKQSVKILEKATERASGSTSKDGILYDDEVASNSPIPKTPEVEMESQEDHNFSTQEKPLGKESSTKASTVHEGKGEILKKASVEPSREEMHGVVFDILKEVDFKTATLGDILEKLEVKATVMDVINSISDEEEEEEAEVNSEAGEDEGEGEDINNNA